jgi:hypothetical protein
MTVRRVAGHHAQRHAAALQDRDEFGTDDGDACGAGRGIRAPAPEGGDRESQSSGCCCRPNANSSWKSTRVTGGPDRRSATARRCRPNRPWWPDRARRRPAWPAAGRCRRGPADRLEAGQHQLGGGETGDGQHQHGQVAHHLARVQHRQQAADQQHQAGRQHPGLVGGVDQVFAGWRAKRSMKGTKPGSRRPAGPSGRLPACGSGAGRRRGSSRSAGPGRETPARCSRAAWNATW